MENTVYGLTPSLFIALALYWGYCLIQGLKSYPEVKTVRDYFIVNRSLPPWIYVFAATATCFSGWTFIGHPAQVYTDGFPGAYASFYAITIPFTGLFFLKRQWMLGKRYGFITPADMFSAYFNSKLIGWLVIVVALLFSIFYIAVQLRATGFLFNVLTDGELSIEWGMFILSIALFLYVLLGGLRAVAYIDTMQAILLTLGIVTLGFVVLHYVGGWKTLNQGIDELVKFQQASGMKLNEAGYSHYVAVPSVMDWNVMDKKDAYPSVWTSTMILSFMIALMGIQASPAFSMWAFSNKSPAPFATQQVWASSFIVGGILIFFTAIQGMGLHLLGTDAAFRGAHSELVNNLAGIFLEDEDITVRYRGTSNEALIPLLIRITQDFPFWLTGLLTGLLAISALAAIQSTAASYMVTAGSMTSHQVFSTKRFSGFSEGWQLGWARVSIVIITFFAGLVAWKFTDSLPILGGAAVAFGLQMVPALICVCWGKWSRWLTSKGVAWGICFGILTVFLTEGFVKLGLSYFGIDFFIGQWPWTIHSAVWGLVINLVVAVIVSFFTQTPEERRHRQEYHNFLEQHASLPESKRKWKIWAWIGVILWFLLALGPGVMWWGNDLFGLVSPTEPDKWWLGMPPIWIWQIFWWLVGVGMMWFLAYYMELSVDVKDEIKPLKEETQS